MKKAKLILIFTIVCFVFIPKVFATNYMSVSKNNVKVGEAFDVTFVAENIQGCDVEITPTANASECTTGLNIPVDGGSGDGRTSFTCTVDEVGTVTFTLSGTITTVGTTENPDGETINLNETLSVTVTAAEEEKPKGLASLNVSGGTLSPSFNSDTNTGYVITLNSAETTSFSINATAKSPDVDSITAKRETGDGYQNIELNNISFVTGGNNSTMLIEISVGEGERLVKYEIQVVKPTKIEKPKLTKLAIDGENVPLVDGVYDYKVEFEDQDSYFITATINDTDNYMFNEFLVPPIKTSSKEIEIGIIPKNPSAGLESVTYHIKIETGAIEPITQPPQNTTKKPSGGGSSGGSNVENPQTGSTPMIVVGIMLVSSLLLSMHLYKKNINGYN